MVVTRSENEWKLVITSKNELQRVRTNYCEWSFRLNFAFFRIRVEPTIKHSKENHLNQIPCEVQWQGPRELRAKDLAKEASNKKCE